MKAAAIASVGRTASRLGVLLPRVFPNHCGPFASTPAERGGHGPALTDPGVVCEDVPEVGVQDGFPHCRSEDVLRFRPFPGCVGIKRRLGVGQVRRLEHCDLLAVRCF